MLHRAIAGVCALRAGYACCLRKRVFAYALLLQGSARRRAYAAACSYKATMSSAATAYSPLFSRATNARGRRMRSREAGAGIEPTNSGFADRCLTTWLPRRLEERR